MPEQLSFRTDPVLNFSYQLGSISDFSSSHLSCHRMSLLYGFFNLRTNRLIRKIGKASGIFKSIQRANHIVPLHLDPGSYR